MEGLISIIVPVYNVEKYIKTCIESLINQSYKKLEIILVDDGSTDNSGKICDQYAEIDSRIIVIHQKNGGAANAKNAGLKVATGEYLTFADSDDYVELDAYESMVSLLLEHNADVVQCGFRQIYSHRSEQYTFSGQQQFNEVEYLERYTTHWTCGLLWDKLYRRELFENIYFEEGHVVDDEFFTYQGIMKAKKIVLDSMIVYNYRQRKSSVTGSEKNRLQIIYDKLDYLVKRRENVVKKYPQLQKRFDRHLVSMLLWLMDDPAINKGAIEEIKKILRFYKKSFFSSDLSLRQRIYLNWIRVCPAEQLLKRVKHKELPVDLDEYFE